MRRTWCTKSYVTKGAQVQSHQDLHTYSTFQYSICSTSHYSTLHYSKVQYITLHYSTLHYSTVHYTTYMQRTWKSSVTRGAQVLGHQNVHTYITLHYNTIHYIPIHWFFFTIFQFFNCSKILSVYKSKDKMENHRFLWNIFLKMGTSPKSSFFQRLARGLRPKNGVVQRGPQ